MQNISLEKDLRDLESLNKGYMIEMNRQLEVKEKYMNWMREYWILKKL